MKTDLENNRIKSGFKAPDDYFDNLSATILSKWNGTYDSNIIPKSAGFSIPEDYFSNNESKLIETIVPKVGKVISLRTKILKVTSIAAVLLFTIMSPLFYNSIETKKSELAALSYLEMNADELSVYEIGVLLENEEISELENELIYNELDLDIETSNLIN